MLSIKLIYIFKPCVTSEVIRKLKIVIARFYKLLVKCNFYAIRKVRQHGQNQKEKIYKSKTILF